jgi:hypothetical protein
VDLDFQTFLIRKNWDVSGEYNLLPTPVIFSLAYFCSLYTQYVCVMVYDLAFSDRRVVLEMMP